jgi:acetyl-CoA C-acetyltransferase
MRLKEESMRDDLIIAGAVRTPVGSLGGVFADVSAVRLAAVVVEESMKRAGVDPARVDEVLLGNGLQAGSGQNVARQAGIAAGIPATSCATTVNQVCGSGLRAVAMAAQQVALGDAEIVVAGGTESMSVAPYILRKARFGYRMGHGELIDSMILDGLTCSIERYHMGLTAETVAAEMGITREQQDAFAAESQARAAVAMESGYLKAEIVPVEVPQPKGPALVVDKDEHPRPGTTVERLAKLRPAFKAGGTVTAGNASGVNDGAAAVTVMTEGTARAMGIHPDARILGYAWGGVEPRVMGLGPVPAVRKLLEKTGLSLDQIELIELNEAFASQSLGVIRELGLNTDIVNVNGGAIALGHPIGASGARILVTLLHEMARRKVRLGMAALCIGGGQGIAMAVENLRV